MILNKRTPGSNKVDNFFLLIFVHIPNCIFYLHPFIIMMSLSVQCFYSFLPIAENTQTVGYLMNRLFFVLLQKENLPINSKNSIWDQVYFSQFDRKIDGFETDHRLCVFGC